MAKKRRKSPMPAPLAALLGWLLPGAGYWAIGQRARGTTIGITIIALFVLGVFLGGIRIVDAPSLQPAGANDNSTIFGRLMNKPAFIGQALTGPLGLICSKIADRVGNFEQGPHARMGEIPTLYTAVAGMLNLLAIMDCAQRAGQEERK